MELRQLKCFLACARNHSLTLAAEELYTTQPHVSMVIKSLEQELGTALFIRKSKGVELTEAGKRIYSYAVNAVRNAEAISALSSERNVPLLRIVSNSSSHMTLLLTHYYLQQKEKLQIEYRECGIEEMIERVSDGVDDLGFSGQFLLWIHCPEEVFASAQYYPQFIYNMGNAILRSLGNTREPLYFLTFSSAWNLLLDVVFVIGLGMGLPGAGIATVISQWGLALIMIWKMTRLDEQYSLQISRLLHGWEELPEIINTGLPSGMQAVFMSISSLLIQYSINSFGADAAAGMVVFARVEGFLYYPAFSYGMALTGFIGQNYGAGKMNRVEEGMKKSILTLSAFTVVAGGILMAAAPVILKLFTTDPEILANGRQAILCIFPFYFLYAINQVYIGGLKGLGKTGFPMLCSLICYCIFRVVWCRILLLFFWDIRVIYFSYDVSWVIMIARLSVAVPRKTKSGGRTENIWHI